MLSNCYRTVIECYQKLRRWVMFVRCSFWPTALLSTRGASLFVRVQRVRVFVAMSGEMKTVFYAKQCPCIDECSSAAWDRDKTWSWESIDDVIKKVSRHLIRSGKHVDITRADDAEPYANTVEIETYEEPIEKYEEWLRDQEGAQLQAARDKTVDARAPSKRRPMTPPIGMAPSPKLSRHDDMSSVVAAAAEAATKVAVAACRSALAQTSSAASGSGQLDTMPRPGRMVTIREGHLRGVIDSVNRARRSARQAEQLCVAASRQFANEGSVLDEVLDVMNSTLPTADRN